MPKGLATDGLASLFGESALEESGEGVSLPISRVEPRAGQPRAHFDEETLAELADSISEHGVIQPITVRRLDGGYYQIIAGERRWRAARLAGLSEIPARIVEADDRKAAELALVENLQREDLNPAEEARGYRALMDEYGLTQEETAQRVGKSRPVVANALRLLRLEKEILDLVEKGSLTLSQARALLAVENGPARLAVAQAAADGGLTVRQMQAMAKRPARAPQKARRTAADGVDYLAQVEKRLSDALGRRVRIAEGRRRGRIEIEYYGSDDFETLCEALAAAAGRGDR